MDMVDGYEMITEFPYYWCCVSCGWNAGTDPLKPGDECDNCGDDEFMCSECARGDGCAHLAR